MAARWEVHVDRSRCNGTGLCVGVADEHFELDGEHRSRVVRAVVDADDVVVDAAACCPMEAITVFEVGSGRLVAP